MTKLLEIDRTTTTTSVIKPRLKPMANNQPGETALPPRTETCCEKGLVMDHKPRRMATKEQTTINPGEQAIMDQPTHRFPSFSKERPSQEHCELTILFYS